MSIRIGVDIGGTFTDLIFYDDSSGAVRVGKVPTTPQAPELGCMNAVNSVLRSGEMAALDYFFHGTTVGLNALLERRGSKVGMLCTRGFRDVLELRRGDRAEVYDLFWQPPEPIVPRRLRLGVGERVGADGSIVEALRVPDVQAAARHFIAEQVDVVAIAFMNAYANGANERAAAEALRDAGYRGEISLSHEISGEYREYERTSTTVVDAFVRGRMSHYLDRLLDMMREQGFAGSALITRSGGGSMLFQEAAKRPFETIMSGPVAGAEGAGELARRFGLGDLVTADVGGTSFDCCIVADGRPVLMFEGEIGGMPLQSSWVDVRSIGSGGGSIAHVDGGGLLRVGPRSAASVPGPASYGCGGTEPCMSDAAFFLGMLGDGVFESGLVLDRARAETALRTVADPLKLSLDDCARGIMEISAAAMANAVREITIEQGRDPRAMKLMAFGGAGPLMGTLLVRDLGIPTVLIPPHAGNFSAWGMLGADIVREAARTRVMPLSDAAIASANATLDTLFAELRSRGSMGAAQASTHATLDLRYEGQEHCLSVAVPCETGAVMLDAEALRALFLTEYRRAFGVQMEAPVELVSLRASLRAALPDRLGARLPVPTSADAPSFIEAYSFAAGKRMPFRVIARDAITQAQVLRGPLIVTEPTATSYIDADFSCRLHASGCLQLDRI